MILSGVRADSGRTQRGNFFVSASRRAWWRPPAYRFRPAASSSHSSACERAAHAASRARPATRRSRAASSFRFACSCLSACASASAALCSRATAVRLSTDASCAARTRVSPTTRSAAALGGSTASESIAPTIMASRFRLPPLRSSHRHLALRAHVPQRREPSGPDGRPWACVSESGTQAHGDHVLSGRWRPCSSRGGGRRWRE
jgi:hypothetical protein